MLPRFRPPDDLDIPSPELTFSNLRTAVAFLVVVFVTPYVFFTYLFVLFSIALFEYPGWVFHTYATQLLLVLSAIVGALGAVYLLHHVDELYADWHVSVWEDYFSEFVASVFVLTFTLGVILVIAGPTALAYPSSGTVPLEHTDVIFLVVYLTFGILVANVRSVLPLVKSCISKLNRTYASVFVPPYTEPAADVRGLARPPLDDPAAPRHAFCLVLGSAGGVLALSWAVLFFDAFTAVIQGHLQLLGYLRDIMAGDPEAVLDGSFGVLEAIVQILDPLVLGLYTAILLLAYAYATSAIYLVRLLLERVRIWAGFSRLGMTAVTVLVSGVLLYVSVRISRYLFLIASSIISIELAAINQ